MRLCGVKRAARLYTCRRDVPWYSAFSSTALFTLFFLHLLGFSAWELVQFCNTPFTGGHASPRDQAKSLAIHPDAGVNSGPTGGVGIAVRVTIPSVPSFLMDETE
jgi:hypothetical protein